MQDSSTSSTVVITGASSGIGLGLAEAYLERGFNVVANARTDERLAAAAKQLGNPARFLGVAGDIGQRDDRAAAHRPRRGALRPGRRAHQQRGHLQRQAVRRIHRGRARPAGGHQPQGLCLRLAGRGKAHGGAPPGPHREHHRQHRAAAEPAGACPAAGAHQGRHQRRDARAGARARAAQRQGECGGARHRRHAAVHARAARLPERPLARRPHRDRCAKSPMRCSTSRAPISRRAWCCRWTAA